MASGVANIKHLSYQHFVDDVKWGSKYRIFPPDISAVSLFRFPVNYRLDNRFSPLLLASASVSLPLFVVYWQDEGERKGANSSKCGEEAEIRMYLRDRAADPAK